MLLLQHSRAMVTRLCSDLDRVAKNAVRQTSATVCSCSRVSSSTEVTVEDAVRAMEGLKTAINTVAYDSSCTAVVAADLRWPEQVFVMIHGRKDDANVQALIAGSVKRAMR